MTSAPAPPQDFRSSSLSAPVTFAPPKIHKRLAPLEQRQTTPQMVKPAPRPEGQKGLLAWAGGVNGITTTYRTFHTKHSETYPHLIPERHDVSLSCGRTVPDHLGKACPAPQPDARVKSRLGGGSSHWVSGDRTIEEADEWRDACSPTSAFPVSVFASAWPDCYRISDIQALPVAPLVPPLRRIYAKANQPNDDLYLCLSLRLCLPTSPPLPLTLSPFQCPTNTGTTWWCCRGTSRAGTASSTSARKLPPLGTYCTRTASRLRINQAHTTEESSPST